MKTVIRNKEGEITHTYYVTSFGRKYYLSKQAMQKINEGINCFDVENFFKGAKKKDLQTELASLISGEVCPKRTLLSIKSINGSFKDGDIIKE